MTLLDRGSSKNKRPENENLKGFSIHNLLYVASGIGHELSIRKPDLVCLEDYSGGHGPQAIHLPFIGEVAGAGKIWLHQTGTRWFELAATTLKKYVTGSGAGKKEVMWLGAYKKWGIDQNVLGSSDNILDAYCLARVALAILWQEEDPSTMPKFEQAVLKAMRVGGSARLSKAAKKKRSADE
jgi:hypothetical protein